MYPSRKRVRVGLSTSQERREDKKQNRKEDQKERWRSLTPRAALSWRILQWWSQVGFNRLGAGGLGFHDFFLLLQTQRLFEDLDNHNYDYMMEDNNNTG